MAVAFASRNPTLSEIERLRLVLSTFRDGSGMLAVGDETFPGWRDFERAVAAVLGGSAPEAKQVFDVMVPSSLYPNTDYGLSIKSKALSLRGGLTNLAKDGRVYMELANSPAKFLAALAEVKFTVRHFSSGKRAQEAGEVILATVARWHTESVELHKKAYDRLLDLNRSRYLVLSYCLPSTKSLIHEYQWHSFDLHFPKKIKWKYTSARCLRGYDPAYPSEALFDLYLLSGGQLKYYPRATTAVYSSPIFQLATPQRVSTLLRTARMYPKEWLAAGGVADFPKEAILSELRSLALLTSEDRVRAVIQEALSKIALLVPNA